MSALSSSPDGLALNRRFGGSETKAGNRNAPFSASVFGSEIILPLESESCPALDVSYSVFLLVTKRLGILTGSFQGKADPDFD
jgi:hypothetical protein